MMNVIKKLFPGNQGSDIAPASLPGKRQRIFQTLATFSLLAAPVSVIAWQANASGTPSANDKTGASTKSTPTYLQAKADQASDEGQPPVSNSSSQNISVETNHSSSSSNSASSSHHVSISSNQTGSNSSASVVVNGQQVKVPPSGEVHKTFSGPNGQTNVDISVNGGQAGQADNGSSSSFNLNINNDEPNNNN